MLNPPPGQANSEPRLLDEVRRILRLHHYSVHTERSYWHRAGFVGGQGCDDDADLHARHAKAGDRRA